MPPTTTAIAARAECLVKRHGHGQAAVTALDGVSIEIPAGSFTSVMGPSGSGKSTLLHCMAGLDSADSGKVWIGDDEITAMADRQLTKGEVSYLMWMNWSVHKFAYFLSTYYTAATPPTLASVRYYFGVAYPQNAGLWPNDKDTNHDMARKLRKWKLPLTRGKAGRPPK